MADKDEAWWGEKADTHPELYRLIDAVGPQAIAVRVTFIYMAVHLLEMYRILKPTGTIYLHCNPTMSHSLKLVMDAI